MTVLQFPHTAATPVASTTTNAAPTSGRTALETYLAGLIAMDPVSMTARKMQDRARRISQVLMWHEIEVLTDPHHLPGARRNNRLWHELDVSAKRHAPASHRMLARTVRAHLPEHEARLMSDCLGIEVEMYFDAPTPA